MAPHVSWSALALLAVAAVATIAAQVLPNPAGAAIPLGAPPMLSNIYDQFSINDFVVYADTFSAANVAALEANKSYVDNVVWSPPPTQASTLLNVGHGAVHSPALFFMNINHIYDIRRPCSLIGPTHYHPRATETNLIVGPGDNTYLIMFTEDLKRIMFFRAIKNSIVAVPPGWIHLPINTCDVSLTLTTFNSYDGGVVYTPLGSVADINTSKVELYNATMDEFKRVWGWTVQAPAMRKMPLPYVKMPKQMFDLPGCAEWCAANVKSKP